MKQKIAERLISVKSIVTIVLTLIFGYLAIRGVIEGKDFMTVFLMIISFYFGTQAQKNADKEASKDE